MKYLFLFFFFSIFTVIAQAPGGVSTDLNYWLKADAGATLFFDSANNLNRVSNWSNQTPGSTNGVNQNVVSSSPVFIESGLNFNPSLSFDGSNDFISATEGYDSNTQIFVFNPTNIVNSNLFFELILAYQIAPGAFADSGIGIGSASFFSCNDAYFVNSGDNDTTSPEYLACLEDANFSSADPFLIAVRENNTGTESEYRLWGENKTPAINNPSEFGTHNNRPFTLGKRHSSSSFFYEGEIMEVISYSSRVNDFDLRKIESYLAIKYGVTLNQEPPQDYINSNSDIIYEANGVLTDFNNDIAGIGRDDASGLNQKQSVSLNTDALVTIGHGSIAQDNASNTNNFTSDLSYLVWGNNNQNITFNTPLVSESSGLAVSHIERIWATQQTGSVNQIEISVPESLFNSSVNQKLLLISDDPVFDQEDEFIFLQNNDGVYTTILNDLEERSYFTFAELTDVLNTESNNLNHTITVSPNPVKNVANIVSSTTILKSIQLYDLKGRLIKDSSVDYKEYSMDISNIDDAVYFLKINTEKGSITKKIVKE